jgi:hypothetical protein
VAVKAKTGKAAALMGYKPGAPKKTHQGQGTRSLAKGTRKLLRGQGKG